MTARHEGYREPADSQTETDPGTAAVVNHPRFPWLDRIRGHLKADEAIYYAAGARVWQLVAGLGTTLLIALFFSPELQGYYYTISSLLSLQTVASLGFLWVILYVASHEWSHLELDERGRVQGDAATASRLASLTRMTRAWFAVIGALFAVAVGAFGVVFLSQRAEAAVWLAPWLSLLGMTGIVIALSPFIAVLEGCNQVATVNRFRLLQAVTGSLVVWCAILLGVGLWVVVFAAAVQLAWEGWLVMGRYRHFWTSLPRQISDEIDWRREIWPFQWRLALQCASLYLASYLFTPVMFHYHGAELAGRMGMTWTALMALRLASFAWVQTKAPKFGMLIARKDYLRLDHLFFRSSGISLAVLAVALAILCCFVWGLNAMEHRFAHHFADRLLPPLPTVVFSIAIFLSHFSQCLNVYVHAHKRDPLLWLLVPANAAIGFAVWVLGSQYGPLGSGIAYLAVLAVLVVPGTTWIWLRSRAVWHT